MKNRTLRWIGVVAFVALTSPLFAQLSGSYTIDPSGSGTNNYTSFTSAISALSTSGVSGAVTFNVKQGTYTEQVTIPAVTGASATNKITFQADPTNTSAATVTYSPTGTSDNWTVRLNGCNDVAIKGLVITSGGTTYGRLLDYTGNVANISLIDNTFDGIASSTSSYYAGIYYTSPAQAQGNWIISGNTMEDVSYAMYIYATSYTTGADTIVIEDNVISTNYYGLYPRYGKYVKIHGNTINNGGTGNVYNYIYYPSVGVDVQNNDMNDVYYGFYLYTAPPSGGTLDLVFENNDIETTYYGIYASCSGSSSYTQFTSASIKNNNIKVGGTSTNYGIYLGYANFPSTAPGVIENNMIACNTTGASSVYGTYLYHCANVVYQHNSVNVTGGSSTAGRACYLNNSTSTSYFTPGGNIIKNNIFVNVGGGYAFEASSSASSGYYTGDYNNFYASSSTPFGSGSSTLSAWQTASSQDANSVWGDPLFASANDLHVQGSSPNNAGTALGVLTDIDGDTRSTTTPDMGADEYVPLTCFGVSGLGAANISDVSFDATWSSNNSTTIGSQVRYRLNGSTGAYTVMAGSTGTATITGLMASTSYDYSVREICSLGDTCSWSADATVTTAACALSNQCQYTVYLIDSFGDGWNGNVVTFTQSGNVNASVTLPGGALDTAYVGLCSWDSVSVDLGTLGSWSYEVSFHVVSAAGDTVVSHIGSSGNNLTLGQNFGSFLPVCTACPPADMCAFTVNMTDSYGDGWNGNIIAFVQNGQVAGSVGSTFTNGSAATEYISLCPDDTVTVQVGTLGSWTSEVGFTVVNPNGIVVFTHTAGNTFTASTVFGQFSSPCLTPSCPVTDTLSIPAQSSCGTASVTFTASPQIRTTRFYGWMRTAQ